MQNSLQAIANEFDSYMQDRAQRLGYRVHFPSPDAVWGLTASTRLALVSFADRVPLPATSAFTVPEGMRMLHDRGHFVAWSGESGALVQVNVYRHETAGDRDQEGRVGVRTFAEAFFGDPQRRSLTLDESSYYLGWLAERVVGAEPGALALAVRMPDTRELALVRLPSLAATHHWVRRNS